MAKQALTVTTTPTTTVAAQPMLASGASTATPAVAAPPALPATMACTGGYAPGTTQARMPAPGSVFAAVLATCGTTGATQAACQVAIAACGRKGTHPLLPLLRWQARNRGWAFAYVGGMVHCYPTLAAYQAAGY